MAAVKTPSPVMLAPHFSLSSHTTVAVAGKPLRLYGEFVGTPDSQLRIRRIDTK